MTFEEGQYAANCAQLIEDGATYLVPANSYDPRSDKRVLIPIVVNHKVGFVNRAAEPVVAPKYDFYLDDCMADSDLIRVGCYEGGVLYNGKPRVERRLGLIDSKGREVLPVAYKGILVSDDRERITILDADRRHFVVDKDGNIIIPKEVYGYIDGFTFGFARVNKSEKWGIVDSRGEVVLPIEYDEVWNFYNKTDLQSTTIEKDGLSDRFYFFTSDHKKRVPRFSNRDFSEERHFEEFAGTYAQDYAGFSDEVINDAFDGEPDAYWNID